MTPDKPPHIQLVDRLMILTVGGYRYHIAITETIIMEDHPIFAETIIIDKPSKWLRESKWYFAQPTAIHFQDVQHDTYEYLPLRCANISKIIITGHIDRTIIPYLKQYKRVTFLQRKGNTMNIRILDELAKDKKVKFGCIDVHSSEYFKYAMGSYYTVLGISNSDVDEFCKYLAKSTTQSLVISSDNITMKNIAKMILACENLTELSIYTPNCKWENITLSTRLRSIDFHMNGPVNIDRLIEYPNLCLEGDIKIDPRLEYAMGKIKLG